MSTETLTLVLDMVGNASTGAFIIALLWVLKGYFYMILGMATICIVVTRFIKFLTYDEETRSTDIGVGNRQRK